MLILDDNMFKLAKMQEALLRTSSLNKEENLSQYKKTIVEIDKKAFNYILEEIKKIDEHNQTLENELVFLEKIKELYTDLELLQKNFEKVCKENGDQSLNLSNLSQLNIEYIESRISTISGYLQNIKNISNNEIKIQQLSEKLAEEEKKKKLLDSKLIELENSLRENFLNAEGRNAIDGRLEVTSIITEYKKIGIDFVGLLTDTSTLDNDISKTEEEEREMSEKFITAEICYNNMLTKESKNVLEEIKKEEIKVKYHLIMLKIIKILSKNYCVYDEVKKKREELLNLTKYRIECLEQFGVRVPIDPFARTKIKEQLELIISLTDNSKNISTIRKEISNLNTKTEEMINQNSDYHLSLSNTRSLIERNLGMNDIDVTSVELTVDILPQKEIELNQVITVRDHSDKMNMDIIRQKTRSVITRVNQMMNEIQPKNEQKTTTIIPNLVIVPKEKTIIKDDVAKIEDTSKTLMIDEIYNIEDKVEDVSESTKTETTDLNQSLNTDDESLFETLTPFEEPQLFVDRTDENELKEETIETTELTLDDINDNKIESSSDGHEEMPNAFWITQDNNDNNSKRGLDDKTISFDDQIKMLLSSEESDTKIKKKVA